MQHMLRYLGTIQFKLSKKKKSEPHYYLAKVIANDKDLDIAILKPQKLKTIFSKLDVSNEEININDPIFSIGMQEKIIHINGGFIYTPEMFHKNYKYPVLTTTATICPGMSGGPLINKDGKIIAVNVSTLCWSYMKKKVIQNAFHVGIPIAQVNAFVNRHL
ncbi:probable periplasmic serine endoprotease DegP-like [Solenopsis invicta]|uniref:probable periplasmic serine endoprotease DegP-like n=1 Tax=Solenopsis invicta TaxID=13686 RepID=UPI00193DE617|nr:probable periplasmic serine endoprotease DegP-like [Solenopsis invicta]